MIDFQPVSEALYFLTRNVAVRGEFRQGVDQLPTDRRFTVRFRERDRAPFVRHQPP